MNSYLLAAACVALLVGVIHSVLGEVLIFRKLRSSGLVPTEPAPPLQARNIRILWATWHLASVFGLALASILLDLASGNLAPDSRLINALIFAFTGGGGLVLFATRGRHPGWIGLFAVAVLVHLGTRG